MWTLRHHSPFNEDGRGVWNLSRILFSWNGTTSENESENYKRRCQHLWISFTLLDTPYFGVYVRQQFERSELVTEFTSYLGVPYESNHPFHLHGYSFRVVAMDKLNQSTTLDEVLALNKTNQIHRNLKNPPLKDTITVPDGGFTIIRFYTANPGLSFYKIKQELN